jgi:hypothetical protein
MKVFVIFGTIEFLDDDEHTALIHGTQYADMVAEQAIEKIAKLYDDCDYIMPHYYTGRITFMQYHKETT